MLESMNVNDVDGRVILLKLQTTWMRLPPEGAEWFAQVMFIKDRFALTTGIKFLLAPLFWWVPCCGNNIHVKLKATVQRFLKMFLLNYLPLVVWMEGWNRLASLCIKKKTGHRRKWFACLCLEVTNSIHQHLINSLINISYLPVISTGCLATSLWS